MGRTAEGGPLQTTHRISFVVTKNSFPLIVVSNTGFLYRLKTLFCRRAPLTYAVDSQLLSSSPRKEEREEREPITAHQLDLARQIDGVCIKQAITSFSSIHSCVTGKRRLARAGDHIKLVAELA